MLVNGQPATAIPVEDRGLLYGDGLFETLLIRGGAPCLWSAHLARLATGAARLRIPLPAPDLLRAEARSLVGGAGDGTGDGTLKLILTRGPGPRGYRPPPLPTPTRLLLFHPSPAPLPADPAARLREGVSAIWCETRLGSNPALAGIKHLNRLEQVLARSEWDDPAIAEGLMRDGQGSVVGGTMSNLFLVEADGLATAPLDRCGIAGTVRAVVLARARALGIPVRVERLWRRDVERARGAFLTNALIGLWPLGRIGARGYDPAAVPTALAEAVLTDSLQPEADW